MSETTTATVGRYRKKPVVIEAVQLTEDVALRCLVDREPGPFGLHVSGEYHSENRTVRRAYADIRTLEGVMRAHLGDWIIRGVKGELYPVKPDIFAETYEAAEPAR
jgi:hypothetical protein